MSKVMVEVGDLDKLKQAIAAFESGHTVFKSDEDTLVELAKRVLAAEGSTERELEVGELVEVHPNIDPDCDWNDLKGFAVVVDTDPDPARPGLIEIRYTRERENLPIQTLINNFSCVRVK
jgi:hypothetical protein